MNRFSAKIPPEETDKDEGYCVKAVSLFYFLFFLKSLYIRVFWVFVFLESEINIYNISSTPILSLKVILRQKLFLVVKQT